MKQVMGIQKKQNIINCNISNIAEIDYNWDSFEIIELVLTEKIRQHHETLNKLTIMDDAKLIIRICTEIRHMTRRINRRW